MAKVEKFEDLIIWQKARLLSREIYAITNTNPFKFDNRFVQQIRAAVGSVMDNIAEGFERDGNKEFVNFLYIAKGSCGEVRSQLTRAYDANFIDQETYNRLYIDCITLSKQIANFIHSIKSSDIKGQKFMKPETTET